MLNVHCCYDAAPDDFTLQVCYRRAAVAVAQQHFHRLHLKPNENSVSSAALSARVSTSATN